MIWALLALLGIPLWFIASVLIAAFMQRRSVLNTDGVFRYKERTAKGWSRRKNTARWVSDVLIEHKGLALLRCDANQVSGIEVLGTPDSVVNGLGDEAVELRIAFTDRDPLRVTVAEGSLSTALNRFGQSGSRATGG